MKNKKIGGLRTILLEAVAGASGLLAGGCTYSDQAAAGMLFSTAGAMSKDPVAGARAMQIGGALMKSAEIESRVEAARVGKTRININVPPAQRTVERRVEREVVVDNMPKFDDSLYMEVTTYTEWIDRNKDGRMNFPEELIKRNGLPSKVFRKGENIKLAVNFMNVDRRNPIRMRRIYIEQVDDEGVATYREKFNLVDGRCKDLLQWKNARPGIYRLRFYSGSQRLMDYTFRVIENPVKKEK